MKIALIGYGKMGKEIEKTALERKHEIILCIDINNAEGFTIPELSKADVAIEFSTPAAAPSNILNCFRAGVPVVCGTTGWIEKIDEIKKICLEKNQAFFYSSNYSIGVNILFEINRRLAEIMNTRPDYDISITETHHTQKLDAPSGTAITLAEDILSRVKRKKNWINLRDAQPTGGEHTGELPITSFRVQNVPGIHTIKYVSGVDSIELTHAAFSRKGFALGAVLAAEWIQGKKGTFGMQDMIRI